MKLGNCLLVAALFCSSVVFAQNVAPSVWRGGNHGVYNESGLLKQWPADGPQILWSVEKLGEGFSSPVIHNNKIFVSTMIEKTGYIVILSMDGKELKRYAYGEEYFESYPGARSTPVLAGNWLYIYSGKGVVYAFDAETGTPKWNQNVLTDGAENIKWGVTETLVVDGDVIYCSPGGEANNVIAFNRLTGKEIWRAAGKGEKSAYCTPTVFEHGGRKLLVTMMASHIIGLDAKTGAMLWSYEQPNQWSVHANTPIYADGMIFATSGYGRGTVGLQLSADGTAVSKVWFNESFDSRMGGIVYLDGHLYGSGDKSRQWQCLDAKTGEAKWSSTEVGKGVVVAADGLLYMYSERGELALADASSTSFNLRSTAKVTLGTAQHWAHPVIHNGVMYLRHGDSLIAYKVK